MNHFRIAFVFLYLYDFLMLTDGAVFAQGCKGVAHGQQDYTWWWGRAPMVNQLSRVRSQHDMLERVHNIEAKLGIGLGGGK